MGDAGRRYKITASDIIFANFQTTVPEEVNWYLHHYVNCDTTTPDRYNWRFSNTARNGPSSRAGIIYIPPKTYVFDDDVIVVPTRSIQFLSCWAQSQIAPEKQIPATISSDWQDFPSPLIRVYAATGLCVASHTTHHLTSLLAPPNRETRWNHPDSPESRWFGEFSAYKANKVHSTFLSIVGILSRRRLRIDGDDALKSYGRALPGIYKITLGEAWRTPSASNGMTSDHERVQTFIHEAAHIAGRVSSAESNNYGPLDSRLLTLWRMRATRNADSYGYYALEVAGVNIAV